MLSFFKEQQCIPGHAVCNALSLGLQSTNTQFVRTQLAMGVSVTTVKRGGRLAFQKVRELYTRPKAVMSIQSHVCFGAAGNSAAVFPMRRLGVEVWPVNTVQFSNHTQYGQWEGLATPTEQIGLLAKGIEDIGMLGRCNAVLSGYLGTEEQGEQASGCSCRHRAIACCSRLPQLASRRQHVAGWLASPNPSPALTLTLTKPCISGARSSASRQSCQPVGPLPV